MMIKESDEYQTPKELFDYLDKVYGPFFWDACCNKNNCLVQEQKSVTNWDNYDYLNYTHFETFHGMNIFMNPPYSNPGPFLRKAWEDSRYFRVVCLVPVSILTASYMDFLAYDEPIERYWLKGLEVQHLSRRVKFTHPTKKTSSPSFGCCLLIMDRRIK